MWQGAGSRGASWPRPRWSWSVSAATGLLWIVIKVVRQAARRWKTEIVSREERDGIMPAVETEVKVGNRFLRGAASSQRTAGLELAALASYGLSSLSYYRGYHPTSRFFDLLVDSYLRSHPLPIGLGSTWLELGCGSGRLGGVSATVDSVTRLYFDLSEAMLRHNRDTTSGVRCIATAFSLPIRGPSIDGLVSFLGDPFNTIEFFVEARRVLKPSGYFLHVVPSAEWGHTLRTSLGYSLSHARFLDEAGKHVVAPSLLLNQHQLGLAVEAAGFSQVSVRAIHADDKTSERAPREVVLAANSADTSVQQLPILLAIEARA